MIFRQHRPNKRISLSNNTNSIKPKIINLSTYKVNTNQIDLRKLGLKYCPTPKNNIGEF